MTSPMPDLYDTVGCERSASSSDLAREIAARDLDLENQLIPASDPRRRQLQTAFAVLSDESRRATYDDALRASLRLTWADLEHLGNFGTFPAAGLQPEPTPPANAYNYPTHVHEPPPEPVFQPFQNATPYTAQVPVAPAYGAVPSFADRPSALKRLGMMILDGLAVGLVTSVVLVGVDTEAVLGTVLAGLIGAAWFLGFEVLTGASPVKHLFGYEVRDQQTGDKLSWEQSAKRQWWRLVNIIPGLGALISFIGMIVIGVSIKPENGLIGVHDRWAGAEVVRKSGR
ncbi:RDD family protein [Corynebacterium nasicanis]|uniref:RDD family protein n=1 Tax=Corynebacterium nasicanis TaxID=1448267 RepID=A0ABW1QEY6_9CORY